MRALANPTWIAIALVTIALQSCARTSDSTVIDVSHLEPRTIIVETRIDGTTARNEIADPELQGPKKIGIQIGILAPTTISTILFTYWRAGNASAPDTDIIAVNESFGEDDINSGHPFFHTPAGVESLEPCGGFYYVWTVNYTRGNGEPATYLSQPRLGFITKRRSATGQIQQALCEPPPGPNDG